MLLLGLIITLVSLNKLPTLLYVLLIILCKITLFSKVYMAVVLKKTLIHSLWVGTISVHPLIFYTFLIVVCFTFYTLKSNSTRHLCFKISTITTVLLFTLFLGGLWGLQSLTWGYVWVSDGIEWLLLALCVYTVIFYHKPRNRGKLLYFCLTLIYIVNLLTLIRLNVVTTRHSFLTNFNTAYIILSCNFIIFTLITTNSNVSVNYQKIDIANTMLACSLIFIILHGNTIYLIKYFSSVTVIFFVIKIHPYMFTKKLGLHFIVFLTSVTWVIYYSFFYLNFIQVWGHSLNPISVYSKVYAWANMLQNPLYSNHFLESISFTVNECLTTINYFKSNLNFSIIFNNYSNLLVIILILFKKGWT